MKDSRSVHPRLDGTDAWRYCLAFVCLAILNGCDASDPIALETSADQKVSVPDATLNLMDGSRDAVDLGQEPDTSGPAECQTEEQNCGNRVDDDCDGAVDECSEGHICEAGVCQRTTNDQNCNNHTDCTAQTICFNSRCEPIRPSACGSVEQCSGATQCSTIELCQAEPACYGTWQAVCETSCDCTGTLLCRESSRTCVACLNGGQCNTDEVCSADGACHPDLTLSADTITTIPQRLLAALKTASSGRQVGFRLRAVYFDGA